LCTSNATNWLDVDRDVHVTLREVDTDDGRGKAGDLLIRIANHPYAMLDVGFTCRRANTAFCCARAIPELTTLYDSCEPPSLSEYDSQIPFFIRAADMATATAECGPWVESSFDEVSQNLTRRTYVRLYFRQDVLVPYTATSEGDVATTQTLLPRQNILHGQYLIRTEVLTSNDTGTSTLPACTLSQAEQWSQTHPLVTLSNFSFTITSMNALYAVGASLLFATLVFLACMIRICCACDCCRERSTSALVRLVASSTD